MLRTYDPVEEEEWEAYQTAREAAVRAIAKAEGR
jgi:hypothetical protein